MSGERDVVNGTKGQGSEGAEVDEGCSRMMKDQAKWMEGKMESTEPDVFIMGATPNQQLKNQVTYDYRSPTIYIYIYIICKGTYTHCAHGSL
jgi:hypothetical protein